MFIASKGGRLLPYPQCTYPPAKSPSMKPTRPSSLPMWPQGLMTYKSSWYGDKDSLSLSSTTEILSYCPPRSSVVSIRGSASSFVYNLVATCSDANSTMLGPLGVSVNVINGSSSIVVVPSCSSGYNGWNVTYGSYVGQLRLVCSDGSRDSFHTPKIGRAHV